MRHPAYPEYKESGVQWLGQVPGHWEVRPIKAIVSAPITDGPHETPEILNEGVPFVSAEAISNGKINFNKIRGYISEEDHRKYSRKYKPKFGDLYMVKSGATTGRVAMVETHDDFNIWSPLAAIRCNPSRADKRFIYFYLQSKEFQTGVELSWSFGTQQNIGMGVIQNLAVPLGTLPEQTAIADFLDRETGRIDTLVAKKRRLIALLKEQRTALISRTVTRGLPADAAREFGLEPHTRFKDSGHPWLGEIPESWDPRRIKEISELVGRIGFRGYSTDDLVDEGEGAISMSPSNMIDGAVDLSKCTWLSWEKYFESPEIQIMQDDVVMVKTGSTIGKTAYVETVTTPMTINPQLMIFKDVKCNKKFLYYYVSSKVIQDVIPLHNTGSTIPTMTQAGIGKLPFPIPSGVEQAAIATYLDQKTAKLDRLAEKVEAAIARLQEYRTALITAAVTGKIDVREAVA